MNQVWKYALWPIALIVVCIMVAAAVYFLLAHNEIIDTNPLSSPSYGSGTYKSNRGGDNERNAINFLNNYNNINRSHFNGVQPPNNRSTKTLFFNGTIPLLTTASSDGSILNSKVTPSLPTFVRISTTTARTISAKSIPYKVPLSTAATTTTTKATATFKIKDKIILVPSAQPPTPIPKNVKVYTNSGDRRKLPQPAPKYTTLLLPTDDDLEENVVERSKLLFPSKETLENFGFTSGHQNNFGVPIEEDERVLRMLNEQMISNQRKLNQSEPFLLGSTTDSNVYQTKVSPTLPNLKRNYATTERIRALNASIDDGMILNYNFGDAIFF